MSCLADIDVAILCGGKGTRARSYLGDTPKVLATLGGRPFIEHLLDYLCGFGAKRVFFLAGPHAKEISYKLAGRTDVEKIMRVDDQRGEWEAVSKVAEEESPYKKMMIVNGDTFLRGDLSVIINGHQGVPVSLNVRGVASGIILSHSWYLRKPPVFAYPVEVLWGFDFIDIGTLEGYRRAQEYFGERLTCDAMSTK